MEDLIEILEEGKITSYGLKERTKAFSYLCFDICESLDSNYYNNHLKSQLFRSATSVAANYTATCNAQSKPSFIAKISIVVEEIDETCYWLSLMIDKNISNNERTRNALNEAKQLTAIFVKSRLTASNNLRNKQ